MKFALLYPLLIPLAGCSWGAVGLAALPASVQLGASVLEGELRMELSAVNEDGTLKFSDEDLAKRDQIMTALAPALVHVTELADAYRIDIDEEIARRQE